MAEQFVSLAAMLRGDAPPVAAPPLEVVVDGENRARPVARAEPAGEALLADLSGEIARVRLAALEALERRAVRTLERIAGDVLARELALAPAALDALVSRALVAFADEEPTAIVVGPDATLCVPRDVPVRVDAALGPGDVTIEVRHGAFESPLTFRLSEVVAGVVEGDDGRP